MGPHFLGIDPGASGGLALIDPSAKSSRLRIWPMPESDWDMCRLLRSIQASSKSDCFAALEEISPATYRSKEKDDESRVYGTIKLYGHYRSIQAILTCLGIPSFTYAPRTWQKEYNLKREKGESDSAWKSRLYHKAICLYPRCSITRQTADAVLLAILCHHKYEREGSCEFKT